MLLIFFSARDYEKGVFLSKIFKKYFFSPVQIDSQHEHFAPLCPCCEFNGATQSSNSDASTKDSKTIQLTKWQCGWAAQCYAGERTRLWFRKRVKHLTLAQLLTGVPLGFRLVNDDDGGGELSGRGTQELNGLVTNQSAVSTNCITCSRGGKGW